MSCPSCGAVNTSTNDVCWVCNQPLREGAAPGATPTPPAPPAPEAVSGADEILKYKQLLDQGILTPEEFAAKKKQLLGL